MILVEGVNKKFKIYRHRSGISGTVRDLFGREYENKKVVKDLNFSIEKGERGGFIGSNDARKFTTIIVKSGISNQ